MNYLALSGIILFFIALTVSIFVYVKDHKNIINITWALFNFCASLWGLGIFIGFTTKSYDVALALGRLYNSVAILIFIFLFHFCVSFAKRNKEKKKELVTYYTIGFTYFLISIVFKESFILDVHPILSFRFYPTVGLTYWFFPIYYLYLFLYGVLLLIKDYKTATSYRKNQLKYLFLGLFLTFIGGFTTLPAVFKIPFPPIGIILTPVYVVLITYAIIKYQLMDIRIVITRSALFAVVYSICLGIPFVILISGETLLIKVFSDSWKIAYTVITVVFASLGLLLYSFLSQRLDKILIKKYKDISLQADKLKKYIPHQLLKHIARGATLKSKRRRITVLFSDIKDFTKITDNLEPEELTELLNEYFEKMTEIAHKWGGTIDKFIGDAVMVLFGAPESLGDETDAINCINMALEMQNSMKYLQEGWYKKGIEFPLEVRIGINTGIATVGNMGAEDRVFYTALGNQVNLASRIEKYCIPGTILITHSTWALTKDKFKYKENPEMEVKGLSRKIKTYEVIL